MAKKKEKMKIVALGGGHGLASNLRGIKNSGAEITAVVTVTDDGGSSGALRRGIGILPPGDIRNCIAALSADEELLGKVLQYRFSQVSGLGGHNLGNLLLTALSEIVGGLEEGIQELSKMLGISGVVYPSTLENVNLVAEIESIADKDKTIEIVYGETQIAQRKGKIKRLWLDPCDVQTPPLVRRAIMSADLIVLGPGSLYTSIIPNLLIPDIICAIESSDAVKLYICNITTQPGETEHYSNLDHVMAIRRIVPELHLDGVICNNFHKSPEGKNINWVRIDPKLAEHVKVFEKDLADNAYPWRHDSDKLTKIIMDTFYTFRPGKRPWNKVRPVTKRNG